MRVVTPGWVSASNIRAFTTTRAGGVSEGTYASLNLGAHSHDDSIAVHRNRQILCDTKRLPGAPRWLHQRHGTLTVDASKADETVAADAAYTSAPDTVCAVLTADCLPILLCDDDGQEVAAVHAGWRGLLYGVVQSALAKFAAPRAQLKAWIGPGISVEAYRVDTGFRERFVAQDPSFGTAFRYKEGQWYADLYTIAERRLHDCGVTRIWRYHGCTYTEEERFYSHRRDGVTGRMATLVWIDSRHKPVISAR